MDLQNEFVLAFLRQDQYAHHNDEEFKNIELRRFSLHGGVVMIDVIEYERYNRRFAVDVFEMLVFVWSKLEKKA